MQQHNSNRREKKKKWSKGFHHHHTVACCCCCCLLLLFVVLHYIAGGTKKEKEATNEWAMYCLMSSLSHCVVCVANVAWRGAIITREFVTHTHTHMRLLAPFLLISVARGRREGRETTTKQEERSFLSFTRWRSDFFNVPKEKTTKKSKRLKRRKQSKAKEWE